MEKGFFVEAVPNFKEGLSQVQEKNYDYAIVDMRLEDGSGLELIKEIKNFVQTPNCFN